MVFDKWDDEEKRLRKNNPNVPRILDKRLKEQVAVEKKYKEMIRLVEGEYYESIMYTSHSK